MKKHKGLFILNYPRISFFDSNGTNLFSGQLNYLPLTDKAVKARGMEIYVDKDLCPIRYATVETLMRDEIFEIINSLQPNELHPCSLISKEIIATLKLDNSPNKFKYYFD